MENTACCGEDLHRGIVVIRGSCGEDEAGAGAGAGAGSESKIDEC
jgi:hypothetical protein